MKKIKSKAKPKKQILRKPKHFNSKIHFLKVRNSKRYISLDSQQVRLKRKLVYEIYNKKTKRKVGYLNHVDKKTKKPLPRIFTKRQINMIKTVKTKSPISKNSEELITFRINNKGYISDQVEKHKEKLQRAINKIRAQKYLMQAQVNSKEYGKMNSVNIVLDKRTSFDAVNDQITKNMLMPVLNQLNVRMSPKRSDTDKRNEIKSVEITLYAKQI